MNNELKLLSSTVNKFTHGYVHQLFNEDGECVEQSFHAGDEVNWEDSNGKPILPVTNFYHPFEMRHPMDFEGLGRTFDDLKKEAQNSGSLTQEYIVKYARELLELAEAELKNSLTVRDET